jgi:hypothetical protein
MELKLVGEVQQGINQEYLAEWIAYREEDLKKPMTPRSIKMLTKKLIQWDEQTQERLICNAIEMGWRGVYWTDPPKVNTTRQADWKDELTNTDWAN